MTKQAANAEVQQALDLLVRRVRYRLPDDVLAKVISIRDSIISVLPEIADLSSSDPNVYTIRQTALDYLPGALQNYLRLPPAYADHQPVTDGKTPKQLLLEQLTLLDNNTKKVINEVRRNDVQQMLIYGRFLKDKFGH